MPPIRTESVRALDRALTILEILAGSKAGLTMAQIVGLSNLPRSTVHCLLITLERRGYLYRNERTSRYHFGLKFLSLANSALSGLRLREQSFPFLRATMVQTGLTIHLGIVENREAVLVSKFEPLGACRLSTWLGKRMDLHCTGVGKVLLASMPREEVLRIYHEHGLPRHNEHTITTLRRLEEDLARTRKLGYSLDDEEDELGFRCIGVPIVGPDSQPVAAISAAGTLEQIPPDRVSDVAKMLWQNAASIAAVLSNDARAEPPALAVPADDGWDSGEAGSDN